MMFATLLSAMVAGRLVWGAVRFILAGLTGSSFPFSAFLSGALLTAVPGILAQLILIPLIVNALTKLETDETLLVQSGKPVGVFKTHDNAPRVLIANSNLVPHWATWEHFNELDAKGLAMYGQMTAGSWIYIGSQGIVQGTYETFVEAGRQHYQGNLSGRWVLTAGLGGMGGAQPLAATLAGACSLNIECQQSRIDFRLRTVSARPVR